MLENMLDGFIPKKILSKVIIINQDSRKLKRYKANLNTNNNKNNLQRLLEIIKIKNLSLLSSYIYIDVNKAKLNLYKKLISTINNL